MTEYDSFLIDQAEEYLRKHRIEELFEDLCTAVAYAKPVDVKKFLKEQLQKKKKEGFKVETFSQDEITSIFSLFDLKKDGFIGRETCKQALQTLCSSKLQWSQIDEANLEDKIDLAAFRQLADTYFFSFKPENHKRKDNSVKLSIPNIQKVCQELYQSHDQNLTSKINGEHLIQYTKQVLNQGGFPDLDDEIFLVSQRELKMETDKNTISFNDFVKFVTYVFDKIQ